MTVPERMCAALKGKAATGGLTRQEIADAIGKPLDQIGSNFARMWRRGDIDVRIVGLDQRYILKSEAAQYQIRRAA